MVFTRLLRNLIRDQSSGTRIVPIIPDEARTFGMDPLFKVGIYAALGQRYEPVDSDLVIRYREAVDGQVLEEGHHGGRLDGQLRRRRASYASHAEATIRLSTSSTRCSASSARATDCGRSGRAGGFVASLMGATGRARR